MKREDDLSSSDCSSSDDVTRSIGEMSPGIDQDSENRVSSATSSSDSENLKIEDMKPSARFGGADIETP